MGDYERKLAIYEERLLAERSRIVEYLIGKMERRDGVTGDVRKAEQSGRSNMTRRGEITDNVYTLY
jgi:hypothetical protein